MFRERSDLTRQTRNLRRSTAQGSVRGMSGYGTTAHGAKRSLKIAGEARVAHELLTDNLFDLAGAQRG